MKQALALFLFIIILSCNHSNFTYNKDLGLIKKYTEVIELTANNGKARLAITPDLQGKILTTTYNGVHGSSNGWFNRESFRTETFSPSGIGGEDRIWIGPLGGQFSFYYQQLKPLDESNWKVPSVLNEEVFDVIDATEEQLLMEKKMKLVNFIGTAFDIKINRKVKILGRPEIEKNLNTSFDENLDYVAYESSHDLINIGSEPWKKESGLAALWSAGMFEGGDDTVVIIPLKESATLSHIYTYMGPLDDTRLKMKDDVILFKVDGKYRSKIGIPPTLAPEIYGCYDENKQRLTIIQYSQTNDSLYFNSNVAIQKNPYEGEVIPIYNNGTIDYSPTDEASFYELESTSAMRELSPRDTLNHFHRVYHFSGSQSELNKLSKKLLGVDLVDYQLK